MGAKAVVLALTPTLERVDLSRNPLGSLRLGVVSEWLEDSEDHVIWAGGP